MQNIFFGLFDCVGQIEVKKFVCDQNTQEWLKKEMGTQLHYFLKDVSEEKEFDPHAIIHSDHLYTISDFPQKSSIDNLITYNADRFDFFTAEDFSMDKPCAVGMVLDINGKKHACFQLFTQKNMLSRNAVLTLIKADKSLKKNDDCLISVSKSLSAIYVDGVLKFKSFHAVKQIFDLKDFYIELSNDQIEQVVNSLNNFTFTDRQAALKTLTVKTRKLFSALAADDYLKTASAKDIVDKVKKDTGIDVAIEKGAVCLPKETQTLFLVLNSMLGNIFEDERTQESHIATAKEKLVRP